MLKFAVCVAAALIALSGRVMAQDWGPPLQQDVQYQIAWQGQTSDGYTTYVDFSDGRRAVMWRPNNSKWIYYKVSDGEVGSIPAQDSYPARNPAPESYQSRNSTWSTPAPYQGGGMVNAGYPQPPAYQPPPPPPQPVYRQQPSQADQAAIAFRMFGMMLCAASGRCY